MSSVSHFYHATFMIAFSHALLANDPTLANARSTPAFQAFLARERTRNDRLKAVLQEQ